MQLGGFAFIGEGIPVGLGAAFRSKYQRVSISHLEGRESFILVAYCGAMTGVCVPSRRCPWILMMKGAPVLLLQIALGDDSHDSVSVNFFGDGTANNGE